MTVLNSKSIKQIIYTSHISDGTDDGDIFEMIKKAQKYNIHREISGFLVSDSKMLVQLIEGNKSDVDELFDKIKIDSRHYDVQIQFEDMTDSRIMPFLGMGLCLINSHSNYQQDFYFNRSQAKEFSSLFEGSAGDFFRQFL